MNSFIKKIIAIYAVCIVTIVVALFVDKDPAIHHIEAFIAEQKINKDKVNWQTSLPKPPSVNFAENKQYLWKVVTNQGAMTIELWPEYAPMHVASTIYLTKLGFYNGLTFHRVISGFMAQGGDPLGNGRGGPGYRYAGEFHQQASHDSRGILSMANSGPNTDGSQFFITFKETRFLDGRHTVFGKLLDGQETLNKLEKLGSGHGVPAEKITILTTSITVKSR